DYNRFNTYPIFADSSQWFQSDLVTPSEYAELTPGGYYCDPQLGCSNPIVGQDISQATAEQFGQEFRLTSDFDGPVNFSAGVNYTTFDVLADYYVMYNLITLLSRLPPLGFGANYLNCPIDLEANLVDPPISMESPEAD